MYDIRRALINGQVRYFVNRIQYNRIEKNYLSACDVSHISLYITNIYDVSRISLLTESVVQSHNQSWKVSELGKLMQS